MSRTYQQLYDDCLSISQQQLPHQLQQPGSGGKPVSVDRIEELVRAAKKGLQYFHPHQSSPLINTHSVSSGPSSATQLQHDRILSASEDTRNGAGMECISPELSASVVASARRQVSSLSMLIYFIFNLSTIGARFGITILIADFCFVLFHLRRLRINYGN